MKGNKADQMWNGRREEIQRLEMVYCLKERHVTLVPRRTCELQNVT
jgi:hypothetical protein